MSDTNFIQSINELHELLGYPEKPEHPLITLIDYSKVHTQNSGMRNVIELYSVSVKKSDGDFTYGRKSYDFSEGSLLCMAPGQLSFFNQSESSCHEGWGLFFHPDLIRASFLKDKIKEYSFFSYDRDEALHLSDSEKTILYSVVGRIYDEFTANLDVHSHDLINANLDVLLNYCKRFYSRQFITRSVHSKGTVAEFDKLLADYFESGKMDIKGLPSVKYFAEKLHLSPNYLSDMLRQDTGKSTMEHIHYYLIERAKDLLLNSSLSISEIAYSLGFEQPPNFSRLFKKKTGMSPKEFIEQSSNK